VEPARQRVAEAGQPAGGSPDDDDVFLACIGELAPSPSALSDANVDEWLQVLGNLSLSHRKNILGEQVEGGGKERSMTHGIKYKLYELRNAPGLEPLRVYWVGSGAYGAEGERDDGMRPGCRTLPGPRWTARSSRRAGRSCPPVSCTSMMTMRTRRTPPWSRRACRNCSH
jgi:hypothetical protein